VFGSVAANPMQTSPGFVCIVLVRGFKSDLEHKRAVELEEAQAYAAENNILHLETSAKNAKNVKQLFVEIAKKLPKNPPETAREAFPIIPPKGTL
jgi:GTPase SAR1 family protein